MTHRPALFQREPAFLATKPNKRAEDVAPERPNTHPFNVPTAPAQLTQLTDSVQGGRVPVDTSRSMVLRHPWVPFSLHCVLTSQNQSCDVTTSPTAWVTWEGDTGPGVTIPLVQVGGLSWTSAREQSCWLHVCDNQVGWPVSGAGMTYRFSTRGLG